MLSLHGSTGREPISLVALSELTIVYTVREISCAVLRSRPFTPLLYTVPHVASSITYGYTPPACLTETVPGAERAEWQHHPHEHEFGGPAPTQRLRAHTTLMCTPGAAQARASGAPRAKSSPQSQTAVWLYGGCGAATLVEPAHGQAAASGQAVWPGCRQQAVASRLSPGCRQAVVRLSPGCGAVEGEASADGKALWRDRTAV